MKNLIKSSFILMMITLVSGALLGMVYDLTKKPIAENAVKKQKEACQNVFADAADFKDAEGFILPENVEALEQYPGASVSPDVVIAFDSAGNTLGYVITVTTNEGYEGDIIFSMGVRLDGTLNGIAILQISETPGLGLKADAILGPQFKDKKVPSFTYTKTGATSPEQIDIITGATITTRAFVNAVNAGLLYFEEITG
jgi:electron transport complex protein RnfG